MSWHWIDVTASIFPAKCGEFLRNIVKTKHLQSYFSGFFYFSQQFWTSESSAFQTYKCFKNQCFLPSVTVLSQELVKSLLSPAGLYFCCSCDCFSDEHKERFFPVWTDVINICVGPRGQFILVHGPQEDSYTCHCRHVLDETLQGPGSALCVSYFPMQHLSPRSIMVFLQQFYI